MRGKHCAANITDSRYIYPGGIFNRKRTSDPPEITYQELYVIANMRKLEWFSRRLELAIGLQNPVQSLRARERQRKVYPSFAATWQHSIGPEISRGSNRRTSPQTLRKRLEISRMW